MTEREVCEEVRSKYLAELEVDEQDVTLGPEGTAVLDGEFTVGELCRVAEAARVAQVRALQLKGVTPLRDTDDDAALFRVHQLRQAVGERADLVELVDSVERSFWRVSDLMIAYAQEATAGNSILAALTPLIGQVLGDYQKLRAAAHKKNGEEAAHLAGDQATIQRVDALAGALARRPTSLAERAIAFAAAVPDVRVGAAYRDNFTVEVETPARPLPEKKSILESVADPTAAMTNALKGAGPAPLPAMTDEEIRQMYLSEPGLPEGGAH